MIKIKGIHNHLLVLENDIETKRTRYNSPSNVFAGIAGSGNCPAIESIRPLESNFISKSDISRPQSNVIKYELLRKKLDNYFQQNVDNKINRK